jgi:hypothetical protein
VNVEELIYPSNMLETISRGLWAARGLQLLILATRTDPRHRNWAA